MYTLADKYTAANLKAFALSKLRGQGTNARTLVTVCSQDAFRDLIAKDEDLKRAIAYKIAACHE